MTLRELEVNDLVKLLGSENEPFLLDVREPHEVDAWSIPGVINVPLAQLGERLQELPTKREVVTICAAGGRSTKAAEALLNAGFDNVTNLTGGMAAWAGAYDTAMVEVDGATVVQVRRRGKGCLSYLVGAGSEAFVVDPSTETKLYVQLAAERGWKITRIFDTHLHADHVSGARVLAEATDAKLQLNAADAFSFDFEPLVDGEVFELPGGTAVSVAALRTPGHTEGSTIFTIGNSVVLSGDTLFVDGVGRPDLAERAEEFAHNLHHSLHNTVLSLGDSTLVLPSHYGSTVAVLADQVVGDTVGNLKAELEALQMDEESFVAWAVARTTKRPPNFVEIVKANMGTSALSIDELSKLEAGPNRCSA